MRKKALNVPDGGNFSANFCQSEIVVADERKRMAMLVFKSCAIEVPPLS